MPAMKVIAIKSPNLIQSKPSYNLDISSVLREINSFGFKRLFCRRFHLVGWSQTKSIDSVSESVSPPSVLSHWLPVLCQCYASAMPVLCQCYASAMPVQYLSLSLSLCYCLVPSVVIHPKLLTNCVILLSSAFMQ